MNTELQVKGAQARALGRTELDNPFLKKENLPAATGESIEAWAEKCESWQTGWVLEDLIRGD